MNYRVRFLQFLILGLIGISLILYTSYTPSHLNAFRSISKHNDGGKSSDAALKLSALDVVSNSINKSNTNDTSLLLSSATGGGGKGIVVATANGTVPSAAHLYQRMLQQSKADLSKVAAAISSSIASSDGKPIEKSSSLPLAKEKEFAAINGNANNKFNGANNNNNNNNNNKLNDNIKNGSLVGPLTKSLYVSGHVIPNTALCPEIGAKIQLLILITSAPTNFDARMAIRQTWGVFGQRRDISIGFVVGMARTAKTNEAIKDEQTMYGDMIQSGFVDAYDNLTLKTISMLEWVDNYCWKVPYLLKTDDDMFINIPRLLVIAEKYSKTKRTIFGRLAKRWKPVRKNNSKYYVSTDQFRPALFPDFTTGPAYLMTSDLVHDLYERALNMSYLKLEDVFTTGLVADSMRVKKIHLNEFLNRKIPFDVCSIRRSISIHMIKFHEQFILWEKMHDTRIRCK